MISPQLSHEQQPAVQAALPWYAPNLLVIGAMKASTTSFYELITRHPDVWFPAAKEPHYFTSPDYNTTAAWRSYLQLFSSAPKTAKVIGEASTGYSKLPHFGNTPQRLRTDLGEPKLIYLLRDPVERVISNYQHSYLAGHYPTGMTLAEALEIDPILLSASRYARQIGAYLDVFDTQDLLIIAVSQLHAEPQVVMRRVEQHLNLRPYDGWEESVASSNSQQALRGSLAIRKLMPKSAVGVLRRVLPASARDRLKTLGSRHTAIPKIDASIRRLILEQLADDLSDLLDRVGGELAPWINDWPSVQQLRREA